MKLRSYRSAKYSGQTVLYRATYDITLAQRGSSWVVPDDTRLKETLPSLLWLHKRARKIVILSWLGRPKRANQPSLRMKPIASRLSALLHQPVLMLNDCIGHEVHQAVVQAKPGSILFLENARFHNEEENNDPKFAKALARNADLMVNDAFGQCHRKVASIIGIPKYIDTYAGPLLEREVDQLSRVFYHPRRPLVAILGGGKMSSEAQIGGQRVPTKIRLVSVFLRTADYLLLGGAIANTILSATGTQIGHSLHNPELEKAVRSFRLSNPKLKIPVDVVTARDTSGRGFARRPTGKIRSSESIYDIGPDTVSLYTEIIRKARTIVWSGPLGYTEEPKFTYGTKGVGAAIARSRAYSIVGGGDTLAALHRAKLLNKMSYVSTAGGAMLEFLERGTLPGLEPLRLNH